MTQQQALTTQDIQHHLGELNAAYANFCGAVQLHDLPENDEKLQKTLTAYIACKQWFPAHNVGIVFDDGLWKLREGE